MADFDTCYPFLLGNEDFTPPRYEIVPDPTSDDPNAKALSGINSARWPRDFALIAALAPADRPAAVKTFYEVNFWNKWLQALDSNRIAAMILDSSVNQGAGWAWRFAQTAAGCAADGHPGPITVAAINDTPEGDFVPKFVAARKGRYQAIGGETVPQWTARAEKVPTFA